MVEQSRYKMELALRSKHLPNQVVSIRFCVEMDFTPCNCSLSEMLHTVVFSSHDPPSAKRGGSKRRYPTTTVSGIPRQDFAKSKPWTHLFSRPAMSRREENDSHTLICRLVKQSSPILAFLHIHRQRRLALIRRFFRRNAGS